MKKIALFSMSIIVGSILTGCTLQTTTNQTEATSGNVVQIKNDIAEKMKISSAMSGHRKDICGDYPGCPANLIYKRSGSKVAFVRTDADPAWIADPFTYTPEKFIVDLEKGNVYYISPYAGSTDYVMNAFSGN